MCSKEDLDFICKYYYETELKLFLEKNKITAFNNLKEFIIFLELNNYNNTIIYKLSLLKNSVEKMSDTAYKNYKEYSSYKSMKNRCSITNSSLKNYKTYVNNKITICERWLESFENFYEDMGPIPSSEYSLDRIDNLKGYYKENCRWADIFTQNRNKSNSVFIYYNNEYKILEDWAKILNIPPATLKYRYKTKKLSFEIAISDDPFNRKVEYNGDKLTLNEFAIKYNIPYKQLSNRVHKNKWCIKDAIEKPFKNN